MVEISGEVIKSAISKRIANSFPKTTDAIPSSIAYKEIRKEQTEQGIEKPCFFVLPISTTQEQRVRNIYDQTYMMNIRYHPRDNETSKNEVLTLVGNKLLDVLSYISIEFPPTPTVMFVRGDEMEYKITDGVLQMFVTYRVTARIPQTEDPLMGSLEIIER